MYPEKKVWLWLSASEFEYLHWIQIKYNKISNCLWVAISLSYFTGKQLGNSAPKTSLDQHVSQIIVA